MTRSALQNAASIAALFLTTEAVIADKPEKNAPAMAAAATAAWAAWTSESGHPQHQHCPAGAVRFGGPPLSACQGLVRITSRCVARVIAT